MLMDERDFDKRPYSPDERRVCDYLIERTKGMIGCGPDPIGFLIATHRQLSDFYRHRVRLKQLNEVIGLELRRQHKEGIVAVNTKMLAEAIALAHANNMIENDVVPDLTELLEANHSAEA